MRGGRLSRQHRARGSAGRRAQSSSLLHPLSRPRLGPAQLVDRSKDAHPRPAPGVVAHSIERVGVHRSMDRGIRPMLAEQQLGAPIGIKVGHAATLCRRGRFARHMLAPPAPARSEPHPLIRSLRFAVGQSRDTKGSKASLARVAWLRREDGTGSRARNASGVDQLHCWQDRPRTPYNRLLQQSRNGIRLQPEV